MASLTLSRFQTAGIWVACLEPTGQSCFHRLAGNPVCAPQTQRDRSPASSTAMGKGTALYCLAKEEPGIPTGTNAGLFKG